MKRLNAGCFSARLPTLRGLSVVQSWQETSRRPASLGTETLCPKPLMGKQRLGCRMAHFVWTRRPSTLFLRAFTPSSGGETSSRSAFCGDCGLSACRKRGIDRVLKSVISLTQLQRDLSCAVRVNQGGTCDEGKTLVMIS